MLRCVIWGGCLLYDYYSCTMAMIDGLTTGSMAQCADGWMEYGGMDHAFLGNMRLGKSPVFVDCIFIVKAKLWYALCFWYHKRIGLDRKNLHRDWNI